MRLLILTSDYPPGAWSGIASAVEAQAKALVQAGAEVDVVVGNHATIRPRTGPRVHRLDPSSFPVDPRRFDRIHLHSLSLAGLAFELRRRYGLPVTYTAHSLLWRELDPGPEADRWIRLQRDVLRASNRVVLLSHSERQAALRILPDAAERSVVIGNAVPDPPHTGRTRRRVGPIVFAGRFTVTKGIELLCELLPRLLHRGSVRAVVAGGHGDTVGTRRIRQLRALPADRFRLAGWLPRPSLRRLLSGAALVLMPSLYEPFGLIALEAMRAGTPVLASRVGGLAEMITPESGGCLACSRDTAEWEYRAARMIESPELWNALHERGPAYVAETFPMHRIAERLLREAYA
ncbi:MAG TPA: glycosyltransferase family 4 protein [Bryobacteraceae bacterium]|nr:glycosyltransferase family 4 protein [Bryobacteraceae bacterium]